MAQCLAFDPAASAVVPVADSPCTTYIALTPAEYSVLSATPFNLSAEDGLLVATAIVGVWAAAFAWRAAIKALGSSDNGEST